MTQFIDSLEHLLVCLAMGNETDIKSPLLTQEVSEIHSDKVKIDSKRDLKQDIVGAILAFISGLIFVGNNTVIQWLKLDFADIIFVRSTIQIALIGSLCYFNKLSLFHSDNDKKTRFFMVLQGFLGGIMITVGFGCVSLMPLGDASTLIFSAPIFTMFFACLCLKHSLGPFRAILGLMLMVGAILVVQPPFIFGSESRSELYYIGAILGVSTAALDGMVNISINFCSEVHSLVLLWWSGLGGLLVSLITLTFHSQAKILNLEFSEVTYQFWIAYLGMSLVGLLAYFCMTKSLQLIDPTVVSFIRSLEIIFAYVVQVLIMHQIPNYLAGIGAILVLISVGSIALQDFLLKKNY